MRDIEEALQARIEEMYDVALRLKVPFENVDNPGRGGKYTASKRPVAEWPNLAGLRRTETDVNDLLLSLASRLDEEASFMSSLLDLCEEANDVDEALETELAEPGDPQRDFESVPWLGSRIMMLMADYYVPGANNEPKDAIDLSSDPA